MYLDGGGTPNIRKTLRIKESSRVVFIFAAETEKSYASNKKTS